jgi:hypothetical protein
MANYLGGFSCYRLKYSLISNAFARALNTKLTTHRTNNLP